MNWNFQEILTKDPSSAWGCDTSGKIPPCGVALRRTSRCTEFHRVKNANLRHPSTMCLCSCKLLMMGVEAPEICWATHKRQVINLWNCCIWLVNLLYDDARTCQRNHLLMYSFGNTSYRCNAAVMGRITNLCTLQNTMNTTERNCVISHAQTTTALRLNVFLTL